MRNSFLILTLMVFLPEIAYPRNLPTEEEIHGIVNQCAAGRVQKVKGDLEAAINIWRKKAIAASGEASLSDLGGIINEIKDDKTKLEAYKIYVDCIIKIMPQYLSEKSDQKTEIYQETHGNQSPAINTGSGSANINYNK